MPEEKQAVETTAEEAVEGSAAEASGEKSQVKSADEIQTELERVQRALKAANKEAADHRIKLKTYEDKEAERVKAQMSEAERLKTEKAELENAKAATETRLRDLLLEREFSRAVSKLNLHFASDVAMEDAFKLADLDGVEIDADGKAKGIEDVVKAFVKVRPHLFAQADKKAADINAGQGTGSGKKPSDTQSRIDEIRQRFRIN